MNFKKSMAYILTLCMMATALTMAVFADGDADDADETEVSVSVTAVADASVVEAGDTFTVTVSVSGDELDLLGGMVTLAPPTGYEDFVTIEDAEAGSADVTLTGDGGLAQEFEAAVTVGETAEVLMTFEVTVKGEITAALPKALTFNVSAVLTFDGGEDEDDFDLDVDSAPITVTVISSMFSGTIAVYGTLSTTNGIEAMLVDDADAPVNSYPIALSVASNKLSFEYAEDDDITPGTYTLIISGEGFLTSETEVVIVADTPKVTAVTDFIPGDIYGSDGAVDFYDFHALCSYINGNTSKAVKTDKSDIKYDLNRDGYITSSDAANLAAGYKAAMEVSQ